MYSQKQPNDSYRFFERYTDYMTGKVKTVSVTLDRNTPQARKQAAEMLHDKISARQHVKDTVNYTLRDLVDAYLAYKKTRSKGSYYRDIYSVLNSTVSILGADLLVNRLTAVYIREQFEATNKKHATLNDYLNKLKALMYWGYKNNMVIDVSFIGKIDMFDDVPKRSKIEDKYLESDELKKLLDSMNNQLWRIVTEFLALSGMRIGELISLDMSDVDTKSRLIHITKTYDVRAHISTTTKTDSSTRDIYIQDELLAVVKKIHKLMLEQQLLYGYKNSDIFVKSRKGERIKARSYNRYLKAKTLDIVGRELTAHALRHTHVSLLTEHGMTLDAIARRLGHEDSSITREIYLHITKRLKEKDYEQIKQIHVL